MRAELKYRLELYRETLESKGFKLSSTEIEHIYCKFRSRKQGVIN